MKNDLAYEGAEEKDQDVLAEERRVEKILNGELEPETITVHKMMKRFKILKVKKNKNDASEPQNVLDLMEREEENVPKKYMDAVKDISFSLKTNECFILLGVNGAGKSTTFKCLTVEEEITSGQMKIANNFIEDYYASPELMRGKVGYCPQTDPLIG